MCLGSTYRQVDLVLRQCQCHSHVMGGRKLLDVMGMEGLERKGGTKD